MRCDRKYKAVSLSPDRQSLATFALPDKVNCELLKFHVTKYSKSETDGMKMKLKKNNMQNSVFHTKLL